MAATATQVPAGGPAAPVGERAGARPFGAESAGQEPLPRRQPDGWEMQPSATTARPQVSTSDAPVASAPGDVLGWAGVATSIPDDPKRLAALWANPKVRHALIVVAGIVVIGVGVALALLSGGGTPPAEELGASLSQVYSAFHTTSPTGSGQYATTAPPTTTPAAAAAAPVGDVATSGASSKSPAPGGNYG